MNEISSLVLADNQTGNHEAGGFLYLVYIMNEKSRRPKAGPQVDGLPVNSSPMDNISAISNIDEENLGQRAQLFLPYRRRVLRPTR